jgi:hypothetical protein
MLLSLYYIVNFFVTIHSPAKSFSMKTMAFFLLWASMALFGSPKNTATNPPTSPYGIVVSEITNLKFFNSVTAQFSDIDQVHHVKLFKNQSNEYHYVVEGTYHGQAKTIVIAIDAANASLTQLKPCGCESQGTVWYPVGGVYRCVDCK